MLEGLQLQKDRTISEELFPTSQLTPDEIAFLDGLGDKTASAISHLLSIINLPADYDTFRINDPKSPTSALGFYTIASAFLARYATEESQPCAMDVSEEKRIALTEDGLEDILSSIED